LGIEGKNEIGDTCGQNEDGWLGFRDRRRDYIALLAWERLGVPRERDVCKPS